LCVLLLILGIVGISNAKLWDRGGGLIYDDVLKITWLQDANYAMTSGYDGDGQMTWREATAWAESLEYYDSVRNVTYGDWRLPRTLPANGSNYDLSTSSNGSKDFGYNISAPGSAYPGSTGSELAYMYYNNLGNKAEVDVNGVYQPGHEAKNAGPFINLQVDYYWSGTEIDWELAWVFSFTSVSESDGVQGWAGKDGVNHSAWAVRDGDVGPVNDPPIADAGIDQVVFDTATLDGRLSHDSDGTIYSYNWQLRNRQNSNYDTSATGENPTVSGLQPGFYDVTLTVTDNDGLVDTDSMLLAVAGQCATFPSDTTPPTGSVHAYPNMIWPANNKMWGIAHLCGWPHILWSWTDDLKHP
jgi:hypothetical protein